MGMLVGEEFSKLFDLDETLSFGENVNIFTVETERKEDIQEMTQEVESNTKQITELMNENTDTKASDKTIKKRTWDDFGDSDSESLEPFNVDDNGNNMNSIEIDKTPKFLKTALENLQKDEPEKIENTLKVLEKLIRDNPPDLIHMTPRLCLLLVHISKVAHMDNFKQIRNNCIQALVYMNPKIAAANLTKSVL
eukprot:UN28934